MNGNQVLDAFLSLDPTTTIGDLGIDFKNLCYSQFQFRLKVLYPSFKMFDKQRRCSQSEVKISEIKSCSM